MSRVSRAIAVVAVLFGCSKKEIGEPCADPSECEFECLVAVHADSNRRVCTKTCDSELDCPDDGQCIGGVCEATCKSQADCPEETRCIAGECLVECRSDDDCVNATCPAPGQVCEQCDGPCS